MPLCSAVTFEMVNDLATVARSKQVSIRFRLDAHEQGIVRRTLCFSVDQSSIHLKQWHATVPPVRVWNVFLNKKRSLFTGAGEFCVELSFAIKTALAQASFSVSCLIMRTDGTMQPFMQLLRLSGGDGVNRMDSGSLPGMTRSDDKEERFLSFPTKNFDDDQLIESLGTVWLKCKSWLYALVTLTSVWWSLMCMCLLVTCIWLRKRFVFARRFMPSFGLWEREFVSSAVFLAGCFVCGLLVLLGWHVISFSLLSGWCLMGMGYAFATPPDQEIFLGRLKKMIGLCLGMTVLPLMLKAYLIYLGF